MSDDLNKYCSVHSGAGSEAKGTKGIVRECLIAFPYIWASVDKVLICGTWVMTLDVAQPLVGECQLLLVLFRSTDLTMFCSLVCEWSPCPIVFHTCRRPLFLAL